MDVAAGIVLDILTMIRRGDGGDRQGSLSAGEPYARRVCAALVDVLAQPQAAIRHSNASWTEGQRLSWVDAVNGVFSSASER
jgi:hypothetical protein